MSDFPNEMSNVGKEKNNNISDTFPANRKYKKHGRKQEREHGVGRGSMLKFSPGIIPTR